MIQLNADCLIRPLGRMSSGHLYFHRDGSTDDCVEFPGRFNRFFFPRLYNMLCNILCEPILSIITNYAEQFRFTVIVHNVSCGQALTLVHPHIQRCILTPVGKTAFRCIQLERRNSQIENDSIHFFDSEILQHVRHLCIIASYDGNPVCIIFQSLCGSGNGICILVDSDESSGCQMSAYFQ